MRDALIETLERTLAARAAQGLGRRRRVVGARAGPRTIVDGRPLTAFASNDYLGLAGDPALAQAAAAAALRWGVGSTASHLVCGHYAPHEALERELAGYVAPCEGARAVTFSTGYLANLAIVSALADRETEVHADKLNHACLNDGALLARAKLVRYAHADVGALARRLAASRARRMMIATDAVFSMDGDLAPLRELLALAEAHDTWLVVDDAHGFGVLGGGRGTLAELRLASPRIVLMGTLGKAAGVAGAFVAAHPAVIETIVQLARPYLYTTAAPPLIAETLRASLERVRDGDALRARLMRNVARFRAGAASLPWRLPPSRTAIQPLIVGGAAEAVALSDLLEMLGVFVPAIRPPTVPEGTARLRVSLSAAHGDDDVDLLLDALAEAARATR
ncbi:MAG: aminotransferase class I/II-fold pyridoxal phosphate-dependent enzyme [Vicinamibacteria bacterium]